VNHPDVVGQLGQKTRNREAGSLKQWCVESHGSQF
jgi:hypothetical protein